MLELLAIKQVQIYIISALIFTILYLILYKYKGINKSLLGYFVAIYNCMSYAICGIFIIYGYKLVVKIIEQGTQYWGIIIPIAWYIIVAEIIKRCIQKDFGITIYKFNVMNYIFLPFRYAGFFATALCFWAAYDSIGNTFQVISLIIVGIIFGVVNKFFLDCFLQITEKKDEEK